MHKLACLTLILTSTACPAPEEGSTGDTGGSSESSGSASSSASMSSTSATSATTSASTSASTSDTTSASTSATTSASTSASTSATEDSSTTDSTSDTGTDDESTGPKDACVGLGREECNADPGCRPITCRPYVMTDNGQTQWCIGEPEFLGCQSADIGCDDGRTVACIGDDAPTYVCPDTCIPLEGMECEPPVEGMVPECP